MKYRVIHDFSDLQDNGHVYKAGDVYPYRSTMPDKARIEELSCGANHIGCALIEAYDDAETDPKEKPKKTATKRKTKTA